MASRSLLLYDLLVIACVAATCAYARRPGWGASNATEYFCSQEAPDMCAGVSLLFPTSPLPGQMLQVKSLNASMSSNDTRYVERVQWRFTNNSRVYLIAQRTNKTKALFLGSRWPYQGIDGRVKESTLVKSGGVILEENDRYGRIKINGTEWCLTFLKCVRNDMGACERDPSRRVANASEIEKGSFMKWMRCLNETTASQWFWPVPETPAPTEAPTDTQAPTLPGETFAPSVSPSIEVSTLAPTENQNREYDGPDEYEKATLAPSSSSTLAPSSSPETNMPTPTDAPPLTSSPVTQSPTTPPPSVSSPQLICAGSVCCTLETLDKCFVTQAQLNPWKGKFLLDVKRRW